MITVILYKGFNNIDELTEKITSKGIMKSKFVIIKFREEYYAICYESSNKQYIFGENTVWYRKNNFFINSDFEKFTPPYEIKIRRKYPLTDKIAKKLISMDENVEIYLYSNKNSTKPTLCNVEEYKCYLVLLGVSFYKDIFFDKDNKKQIQLYFKDYSMIEYLIDEYIIQINPFHNLILTSEGELFKYGVHINFDGVDFIFPKKIEDYLNKRYNNKRR